MGKLLVNEKDIAVPGEDLAEGMDYLPALGTYRDKEAIVASYFVFVSISGRLVKVIPLSGRYNPRRDDIVIGMVADMTFSNWFVDVDYATEAVLSSKETGEYVQRGTDLSQIYGIGDYIIARVMGVSKQKAIDLSMRGPGLRKITNGRIIKVDSVKVPRIIGKEGSMISLIKEKTGCRIMVGQNGKIWIQGDDIKKERVAVTAINMINEKPHINGLTDKIKEFLEKELKNVQ